MNDDDALGPPPEGPVGPDGAIRVGRYAGALDEVRWGYPSGWLHGQVRRALGRKRWFQAGIFADNLLVVVRVVDHGLAGSGLVWVAELDSGRTLLEQRIPGVPLANLAVGPFAGRGTEAHVTLPLARIRLYREGRSSAWELTAHVPGHALSLGLDTRQAPTPMMVVGEPSPGNGILMQRFIGLEARGTVRIRSELKSLEGGRGFLEYGNGFFPRPLTWSTALVAGGHDAVPWAFLSDLTAFGTAGESAIWEGRTPRALAEPRLSSGGGHGPWQVAVNDAVGLSFQPRVSATESCGAGPTGMRHALVGGKFEGELRTRDGLKRIEAFGLCEARSFG